jgi:hypothetical protein
LTALCSCGGGSTPARLPPEARLSSAVATGCIYPGTQGQTVALPSAGGVSGTISIGAAAQASATCDAITLATGGDATLSAAATSVRSDSANGRSLDAAAAPPPLAQVQLTNVYSGQLTWVAITLNLPSGSIPAGHYPATITTTFDLGDGQVSTSVANFTITVAADGTAVVTGPSVGMSLAVLNANTTGLLSIYPAGTVLPSPTPVPSASPTPTATPSGGPSATPSPTPTASVSPTPAPTATPVATSTPVNTMGNCAVAPGGSCGSASVIGSYDGGPNAGQSINQTEEVSLSDDYQNAFGVSVPLYFAGTVKVVLSNYYPGQQIVDGTSTFPADDDPCPAGFVTQSGSDGDTFTATFPANGQPYYLQSDGPGNGYGCAEFIYPYQGMYQGYQGLNFFYGAFPPGKN